MEDRRQTKKAPQLARLFHLYKTKKNPLCSGLNVFYNKEIGLLEGIRTPDLCLRRATLYPAELRAVWRRIVLEALHAGKGFFASKTGLMFQFFHQRIVKMQRLGEFMQIDDFLAVKIATDDA